jgi:hypothetical protein
MNKKKSSRSTNKTNKNKRGILGKHWQESEYNKIPEINSLEIQTKYSLLNNQSK